MKHQQPIHFITLNFLISGTLSFISIYLPLILQEKSFSMFEIGLTLSLGSLAGFFGQLLWGIVSDKFGTIRIILLTVFVGTAVFISGLYIANVFFVILFFAILIRIFTTSILPLTDLWTMNYTELTGRNFGVYRQCGSIGYVVIVLGMGGAAAKFGLMAVFWVHWGILALCIIAVFRMRETKNVQRKTVDLRNLFFLFRNPQLWIFFIAILLVNIPSSAFNSFYSIYVKQLGGGDMVIAFAAIIAPICQIPYFILTTRWTERFGIYPVLTVSAGIYAILWSVFIWNHSLPFLILSQIGLSGAKVLFYVAGMFHMRRHIPEYLRSTGQLVLFMFMFTLSGFAGNLWTGHMLDLGYRSQLFLTSMLASMIALLILLSLSLFNKTKRSF